MITRAGITKQTCNNSTYIISPQNDVTLDMSVLFQCYNDTLKHPNYSMICYTLIFYSSKREKNTESIQSPRLPKHARESKPVIIVTHQLRPRPL